MLIARPDVPSQRGNPGHLHGQRCRLALVALLTLRALQVTGEAKIFSTLKSCSSTISKPHPALLHPISRTRRAISRLGGSSRQAALPGSLTISIRQPAFSPVSRRNRPTNSNRSQQTYPNFRRDPGENGTFRQPVNRASPPAQTAPNKTDARTPSSPPASPAAPPPPYSSRSSADSRRTAS